MINFWKGLDDWFLSLTNYYEKSLIIFAVDFETGFCVTTMVSCTANIPKVPMCRSWTSVDICMRCSLLLWWLTIGGKGESVTFTSVCFYLIIHIALEKINSCVLTETKKCKRPCESSYIFKDTVSVASKLW